MLHGHAVYCAFLAKQENFISEAECRRIMNLSSDMEVALWHDITDNHDLFESCNTKITVKRGGNQPVRPAAQVSRKVRIPQ